MRTMKNKDKKSRFRAYLMKITIIFSFITRAKTHTKSSQPTVSYHKSETNLTLWYKLSSRIPLWLLRLKIFIFQIFISTELIKSQSPNNLSRQPSITFPHFPEPSFHLRLEKYWYRKIANFPNKILNINKNFSLVS